MEFQQLQEVGVFSYLCYSLAKSHVNDLGYSEARFNRIFDLKTIEPSGENPNLCGHEQCRPEGFTVHMIFGVIFVLLGNSN